MLDQAVSGMLSSVGNLNTVIRFFLYLWKRRKGNLITNQSIQEPISYWFDDENYLGATFHQKNYGWWVLRLHFGQCVPPFFALHCLPACSQACSGVIRRYYFDYKRKPINAHQTEYLKLPTGFGKWQGWTKTIKHMQVLLFFGQGVNERQANRYNSTAGFSFVRTLIFPVIYDFETF